MTNAGRPNKPNAPRRPASEDASTLRATRSELNAFRQELDSTDPIAEESTRRRFRRWRFSRIVNIKMCHPGGTETSLRYACRNLSATGMGVLHSAFVYPGTRVVVRLPHLIHADVEIEGSVMRCRHWRGKIHEVGIRFDEPINLREHVVPDTDEEFFILESINPASLSGTLLLIESLQTDRELYRHHLKETELDILSAETGEDAIARAGECFDLIVCDLELNDISGLEVVGKLREAGNQTPIIILTANDEPVIIESIRASGVDGFLTKPITKYRLLRAIGELLLFNPDTRASGGAIVSTLAADSAEATLIPGFIEDLKRVADQINKAIEAENADQGTRLCLQLRGIAPGLGFEAIADAANQAYQSLNNAESFTDAVRGLRALVATCLRVRIDEPEADESAEAAQAKSPKQAETTEQVEDTEKAEPAKPDASAA